jgi:hypothetical protein
VPKRYFFRREIVAQAVAQHLEDYVSMQNPRDNMVYVVSLSIQPINEGAAYS